MVSQKMEKEHLSQSEIVRKAEKCRDEHEAGQGEDRGQECFGELFKDGGELMLLICR